MPSPREGPETVTTRKDEPYSEGESLRNRLIENEYKIRNFNIVVKKNSGRDERFQTQFKERRLEGV